MLPDKIDHLDPTRLITVLSAAAELGIADEIFPVSARQGEGGLELRAHLGTLVPHSLEVVVDEITVLRDDLTRVQGMIWVEAESQKGILIGADGKMIKTIGIAARRSSSANATHVHLDLSVRVRKSGAATNGRWTGWGSSSA